VVIAVSAAESAAMAMRTTTSHKLFFSFIFLIYNLTIYNLLIYCINLNTEIQRYRVFFSLRFIVYR
jgi:hypothetical protein